MFTIPHLSSKIKRAAEVSSFLASPLGTDWSAVAFAVRTTAASLIALYVAFLINLDDPKWAAMTVWIVAQGNRGMSLSKSQYRLAGTGIGAVVAVALMAVAAQAPEVFLILLALWIGLCTAVATGLRNFRSYGAVLAGYTAIIIAMDAVSDPESIFDIAVSRVIYIALGITVEAVLAALLSPADPMETVTDKLGVHLANVCSAASAALRRTGRDPVVHSLFAAAAVLDTTLEYAATSSTAVRKKLGYFREATVASLEILALGQSLQTSLLNVDGPDQACVAETAALLEMGARHPQACLSKVNTLKSQIKARMDRELASFPGQLTPTVLIFDRLLSLLDALEEALTAQINVNHPSPTRLHPRLSSHIDHLAAFHNGFRACVAVLAASAIWIMTAWSSGAGFVTITGVICALFATRPNAVRGGLGFLKGTICAALAATLCNFVVIPVIDGFFLLALMMALFMIPAGVAMRKPATAGPAAGFAIFFWDLVAPNNMIRADATSFYNGAIALVLGIACGTLVFALLFPANMKAGRVRVLQAMRRDLAHLGRHRPRSSSHAWVTLTADRLALLLVSSSVVSAERAESDLRDGIAMLQIGKSAIAISQLKLRDPGAVAQIKGMLTAVGGLGADKLALRAEETSQFMLKASSRQNGQEQALSLRAAVLALQISAELQAANPVVWHPNGLCCKNFWSRKIREKYSLS